MAELFLQRCLNHQVREAVARCPECGNYFCRECISEHEDRVVCAACLKKITSGPLLKGRGLAIVLRFAQCAFGFVLVWVFFYFIGTTLLSVPSAFHEGTLWQVQWWETE